jgi:hypothetical protein
MTWSYWVYGLGLVTDRPIPGLTPVDGLTAPDVEVSLGGGPHRIDHCRNQALSLQYVSANRDARGEPILRVWVDEGDGSFRLRYRDGVEFGVDQRGTRVWASGPEGAIPEYLAVYLLGPVLGFVLRLRGIICLHASAVMVGNRALAFVGSPGAGKSTLAAAFALSGYPVLGDDVLPLREADGLFLAGPGTPRLCLWPDAVAHLYGSPEVLPRLIPENSLDPNWDKRCLDLTREGYRFQSGPLPLAACYHLDGHGEYAGQTRISPLSPGEAMMVLTANTYRNELLDRPLRAGEFEMLGRLTARVPVRRVVSRSGAAYLSELCEAILQDCQSLQSLSAISTNAPAPEFHENRGP